MAETNVDTSFFISGGTVPLGAASYVLRGADRALLEALLAGRYAYVLTSRQMGKSSLSVRTMEALRERGVRTAFVDLTRVGGRNVTADQWYAGLLGEIGRGLGDRAAMLGHWKAHPDLGPMQRFFGALGRAVDASEAPIVVFIDEIDATRSLPFSTDEFFAGIRECFNRRVEDSAMTRLTFCLIGVAIPSDLMSDAKLTPFNVGERIVLRDFSSHEAAALAAGLGPSGATLLERVVHWTGGHPFLTQSLGRRLAEENARTVADVDPVVAEEFFGARARETNVNLADVGNRVLNSYEDPKETAAYRSNVLALYDSVRRGKQVPDDESNRFVAVLKLAGLVIASDGRLRVRNRIYERVFGSGCVEEHMPNQELRRQRASFRVGAIRTAALSAAVLAVVSSLAVSASRSAAEAKAALSKAKSEEARALTAEGEAKGLTAARTVALGEATAARTKAMTLAEERKAALDRAKVAEGRALAQSRLASTAAHAADVQRRLAELQRRNALLQKTFALGQRDLARRNADEAGRQRALAIQGQESLRGELYENAIESASLEWERNDRAETAVVLASVANRKGKGWEWGYWNRRAKAAYVLHATDNSQLLQTSVPSEGTDIIVSDGLAAWRVDPETGRTVRELWRLPAPNSVPMDFSGNRYPLFSRNGRWAIHRDEKGERVLRDLASGEVLPLHLPTTGYSIVSVSDDGRRVAGVATRPGSLVDAGPSVVWDARTGASLPIHPPDARIAETGNLTPDGRALRGTYRDPEGGRFGMAEYDYTTGVTKRIYAFSRNVPLNGVTPSVTYRTARDGTVVVACGSKIGVFDAGRSEPRLVFDCLTDRQFLSISQDGRSLVTTNAPWSSAERSESVLWDLATGAQVASLPYRGNVVGNGRILLAVGSRETMGVDWRATAPFHEAQVGAPEASVPTFGSSPSEPNMVRQSFSLLPNGAVVLQRYQLKTGPGGATRSSLSCRILSTTPMGGSGAVIPRPAIWRRTQACPRTTVGSPVGARRSVTRYGACPT